MNREALLSRGVGLFCLAALACLPACDGGDGTGGSGGDGGVAQGGNGGAGGAAGQGGTGGNPTTSGEGGGTVEECTPACDQYSSCVLGQCAPILGVALLATESTVVQPDGSVTVSASLSACEGPLAPGDRGEILAEEGDCRVVVPATVSSTSAKFGAIVASAPSFGTAELELLPENPACAVAELDVVPGFLQGESVTFDVAAGTGIPAFTTSTSSPLVPDLGITAGTFTKGQPYTVSWGAGGPLPFIGVLVLDGDVTLECTPTQGTSLTIPATLTDLVESSQTYAIVYAFARSEVTTVAVTPTYQATTATNRAHIAGVLYEAP